MEYVIYIIRFTLKEIVMHVKVKHSQTCITNRRGKGETTVNACVAGISPDKDLKSKHALHYIEWNNIPLMYWIHVSFIFIFISQFGHDLYCGDSA